ncbi:hypothetical protein SO802_027152 [Lithocarpus litseifolius]|uniref:Bet v I/Major latex protein domain-containing protein n=1 Tax=Lithocarpus litseifolius TaxID=425828 RepID=A0AAW2C3M2_9ROSI
MAETSLDDLPRQTWPFRQVYKYHPQILKLAKYLKFNKLIYSFHSSFDHFIIMGVFTYETETTSIIAPAKLFKAFVLDGDNLIPKVAPHAIKSVEIIEGNGGPGTIKKITFGEG